MRTTRMFGILLTVALGTVSLSAQVVVIISAKNPISKLTPDQVSQIFLGQAKTYYTGAMAEPVDNALAANTRKIFYEKVMGKSEAQLKAYWAKQSFSGMGQPPKVLPNDREVVKLVAENPKYIGYVDKSAVDASVKIVLSL